MTTQISEEKQAPEQPTHNLFSRPIRPIRNWSEWLERWQAAVTIEEMLGLLHYGFNVPISKLGWNEKEFTETDRLAFYFGIADGWSKGYALLQRPEDRGEFVFGEDERGCAKRRLSYELRGMLATKAFDILCMNYFKPELHRESINGYTNPKNDWASIIADERLFQIIIGFFAVEGKPTYNGRVDIRNLSNGRSRSHNEENACAFLLGICSFALSWHEKTVDSWISEEGRSEIAKKNLFMRAQIEKASTWMIEALYFLGRLDALDKHILELDKAYLDALRKIALRCQFSRYSHPVTEDRLVVNLDEACYLGSPAALFLKHRELMLREHERLTAIRDAESAREEAGRKIKELTGK